MSIKKTKKFGLWTAISLIVGSIAGIGIFFKNISIFNGAGGNGVVILLAWIFAALIALGAALSFAEVGTGVSSKAGLSSYIHKLIGKRFGKICKIVEPTVYHSILIFALTCYTSEVILQSVLPSTLSLKQDVHIGLVLLMGSALYFFFWTISMISAKTTGVIQNVTVALKFLPLIVVAIVGIAGIGGQHSGSVFTSGKFKMPGEKPTTISAFSFSALIMILPAALFAFDGFIHVTNISTDIENPKKNVPLGITIGIAGVLVLYMLITLGQLLTGKAMPEEVLSGITTNLNAKIIISRTLNIFIAISALGVCNGIVFSQVRSTEAAIEEELLIGSKWFKNKLPKTYGFVYAAIIYLIVFISIGTPTIIVNTDSIIDCITNFPVLYFFVLYTAIIIAQIFNRQKIKQISLKGWKIYIERSNEQRLKTKNTKCWIFYPLAIISIIGISTCLGYVLFYSSIYKVIQDPSGIAPWGAFYDGPKLKNFHVAIIFFTTLVIFIALPVGIYLFQSKKNKLNK